jgi:hypothetical protein
MNRSDEPIDFELHVAGDGRAVGLPARAITTVIVPAPAATVVS